MPLLVRLAFVPLSCIAAISIVCGYSVTRPRSDLTTKFTFLFICMALIYYTAKVLLRRISTVSHDPTLQLIRELYLLVAYRYERDEWWLASQGNATLTISIEGGVAIIDLFGPGKRRHYRITPNNQVIQRTARSDAPSITHDRLRQLLDAVRSGISRDAFEPRVAVRTTRIP